MHKKNKMFLGTSLAVQWLRPHTSTAVGMGSVPGRGTKILHAVRCDQKKVSAIQELILSPR